MNVLTLETIFEMFEVNIETQQYLEATNRIEIDLVQQNNRLQIQCRYDTNRFCMSKVTDIIKAYAKSLQDVAGILSECGLEMKVANQFSNSKVTLQDLNKILK